jgi:putative protease
LDSGVYREVKDKLDGYFDVSFLPLFSDEVKVANGIYLPPVIMESEIGEVRARLSDVTSDEIERYALVGNIGAVSLAREFGLIPVADFRLNITNAQSAAAYADMGIYYRILSPELTLPQARDVGGAVITYGRIPLMLTERCFIKENFGCDRCGKSALTDRKGEKFPIIREYAHRNLILNSHLTYMGDRTEELRRASLFGAHFIFSVENAREILNAVSSYKSGAPLDSASVRRMGRRK